MHSHQHLVLGTDQAIGIDEVVERSITGPVSLACLTQDVGSLGHALHPPGKDHMLFTETNGHVGERHRPQPGPADPVDGVGRHGAVETQAETDLPSRILAGSGLQHLAEIHMLDILPCHSGPLQSRCWRRGHQGQPTKVPKGHH